jgi:MFS family permease
VGALIGSFAAVGLVGRERLGVPFVGAGVLFGLALAGIAIAPNPVVAPLLLALAGVGSALVYVAGQTLIQRLASDDVLSRVFGVLEGLMMAATALGAISVPVIVAVVGPAGAFVVAGLSLPLVALLLGRSIAAGDRATLRAGTELALLRAVPMFAPLPAATLERLARGLERIDCPAGAPIIRQGERGDHYYVIAEGTVTIHVDGRAVREQGPGEGFGEIALMRDVPRTASVSAIGPVVAFALGRDAFIEAVTGHPASRHAVDSLVRERLETA